MQTIKLPRLFWAYLRRHARLIALFAVFSLVFGVVFALYDLPVEAVAYASAICLALGGVAAAFGLNAFRHRHEALVALRENAALGVDDMPPPRDLLEEDLQAIIRRLQSGWQEEISRADQERADMLEYYTLWVHQAKTPLAAMGLLLAGREDAAALEAERFKLERYVDMALQYARLGADASDFVLREGALADLIVVDLQKPHLQPIHDVVSNLVYCGKAADVETVVVDGRIVVEGRRIEGLDLTDLYARVAGTVRRITALG